MNIRNEAELVTALQQREPSAFATLVELVGPRLVSSATRILRSRQEAEDAMQETLLAVWKGIEKFEGGSSLYTWMHRILINNCLARLRSIRSDKEIAIKLGLYTPPTLMEQIQRLKDIPPEGTA